LNRWQGGSTREIGSNKAVLLAAHLREMFDEGVLNVKAVPASILSADAEDELKAVDVMVGCLDSVLPRYFLNRFALQYAVPFFDAGVVIAAGAEIDFQHRYFSVIPGCTPCWECSGYELIDHEELNRELMNPVTAAERKSAGYVENRPEIAAVSAYPLNLRAVGTLITELLNWVCGFRPVATCVAERWQDGWQQRSDRQSHPERPDPACFNCSQLFGAADRAELPRPSSLEKTARLFEEARKRRRTAH
jgi:molybdopterin/thiamine biosynthesis adenylyltransferase